MEEPQQIPASCSSTNQFEMITGMGDLSEGDQEAAKQLLELFPHVRKDYLLDLFKLSSQNLAYTVNHLLDGGYGDEEEGAAAATTPPEGGETRAPEEKKNVPLKKDDSGDDLNTCSDAEENSASSSNEDWTTFELPMEFVQKVVNFYGQQPGFELAKVTAEDRIIQLIPDLAFDLFKYMCVGVDKSDLLEKDEAAVASSSTSSSSVCAATSNPSKGNEKNGEDLYFEDVLEWDPENGLQTGASGDSNGQFKSIIRQDVLKSLQDTEKYQHLMNMKLNMSQTIKISELQRIFPSLSRNTIEDVFRRLYCDYDKALATLKSIYPLKWITPPQQIEIPRVNRSRSVSGNKDVYDPDFVAQMSLQEKRQLLEDAALWRNRAEELGNAWSEAKKSASTQKSVKSAYPLYICQATQLKDEATKALDNYWYYTLLSFNAGNKNPNKIDLHGLGVNKAKEMVSKYLQNRKTWAINKLPRNSSIRITIITGQGRHSLNNVPKLNPAIRNFLIEHHYSYTEGDCIGSFVVQITNKEAYKRRTVTANTSKPKSYKKTY